MHLEDILIGLVCCGVFLIVPLVLAIVASIRAKRALRGQMQLAEKVEALERQVTRVSRAAAPLIASTLPAPSPAKRPHPSAAGEPARPAVGAHLAPEQPPPSRPVIPAAVATTTAPASTAPASTAPASTARAADATQPGRTRSGTPVPQWHERVRAQFATTEWEAVVGGSWLNKVGVLVLVIGIALFLGYSLTHFGAVGRLLIGYVVSVAMIIGGVLLLRRRGFRVFAGGLLGGGWAALYFTVYAMHGLEAARVIDDPLVGITLLGFTAAMMIAHALHYRSESATAMALLFGFITIVISPVSLFASLSSVPLVVAVVTIAHRFSWLRIAIGGLIVTYATYALRFGSGLFQESLPGELFIGQSVLLAYWLLYEGFDLISVAKRRLGRTLAATLFPLNACGFLGVSLLQWLEISPETLSTFFALAAAMFLVSSLLRARRRSPSSLDDSVGRFDRVASGYEAAITISAALAVFAILHQFTGPSVTIALLLEGGLLFFAGLLLKQTYLRALASAVYAFLCLRVVAIDLPTGGEVTVAGFSLMLWTPTALLSAASFYLNRAMIRPFHPVGRLVMEGGYSYAATALLTLVVGFELPAEITGLTWLAIALVLLELGIRVSAEEFRVQAALVGGMATSSLMTVNGVLVAKQPWVAAAVLPAWIWLLPAAVLLYLAALRLYQRPPVALGDELRGWRHVSLTVAAALLTTLLWQALPTPVVALGWAALALLLVELGFRWQNPPLRIQGHLIAALAFGRLFLANFTNPGVTGIISHRMLTVIPIIVFLYYLRSKLNWEQLRDRVIAWERRLPIIYLYAPFVLIALLMRFELGRVFAVLGWSVLCVVLFVVGRGSNNRDLRWQSYLVAVLTFARCWSSNFNIPESLTGVFGRVGTGAAVIACFYLAQYLAPRSPAESSSSPQQAAVADGNRIRRWLMSLDQNARNMFSILGTVLLAVLVYYEVSGRLLTVAWGVQGTVLLMVGFAARERVLRLAGLALLTLCTIKVFMVDLRTLETPFRILSFVLLGILLIAVSWFYTTYRKQIQQRV